jgi:hypothetical protein
MNSSTARLSNLKYECRLTPRWRFRNSNSLFIKSRPSSSEPNTYELFSTLLSPLVNDMLTDRVESDLVNAGFSPVAFLELHTQKLLHSKFLYVFIIFHHNKSRLHSYKALNDIIKRCDLAMFTLLTKCKQNIPYKSYNL